MRHKEKISLMKDKFRIKKYLVNISKEYNLEPIKFLKSNVLLCKKNKQLFICKGLKWEIFSLSWLHISKIIAALKLIHEIFFYKNSKVKKAIPISLYKTDYKTYIIYRAVGDPLKQKTRIKKSEQISAIHYLYSFKNIEKNLSSVQRQLIFPLNSILLKSFINILSNFRNIGLYEILYALKTLWSAQKLVKNQRHAVLLHNDIQNSNFVFQDNKPLLIDFSESSLEKKFILNDLFAFYFVKKNKSFYDNKIRSFIKKCGFKIDNPSYAAQKKLFLINYYFYKIKKYRHCNPSDLDKLKSLIK